MPSIPKLSLGHQRQASVDTTHSNNSSDETTSNSSSTLSNNFLSGTISSDNLISQFIEPLSNARKSNAKIHWKCVHVISHPDFERNALDDDSSYHTTLQLIPFSSMDVATQKSRFAIIHSSKKGVSVLELINELTQSTDNKIGNQWIVKYHTKLESNGFGSSAVLTKQTTEKKEKIVFFGGYFHENQESNDKSSLFQSQQRYSLESISHNRTLTSRMKKLFKSSKGDVSACPHPSNMFFKYRFDKYEFGFSKSGEENSGSEKTLSRKPSFMTGTTNYWPATHANHKILSVGKEIYVFGGHYMKWNELTEDNQNDAEKRTSFVYIFDTKRKKFEQPKLVSFTLPKPQSSVSTTVSTDSLDSASTPTAETHKDIQLPIENEVDSKQKERRNFLLDSIKSFSRERKNSFHDGDKMMTDLRDIAPMNRFGHNVVNVNGVAYIYGGKLRKQYNSGNPDQVNPHSDDSVYSFNFRTGQFSRLRIKSHDKPHPRMFHAMVEIPENNCFLMMGGQNVTEQVLEDETLSMMMEEVKMKKGTETEATNFLDDCYVFDILRSEWSKVKQSGHLPLNASNFGFEHEATRVPVALARTKEGDFLCVVKNGLGSLEVYLGQSNF
ncbi:hypothetical protein NAEGRDRAFT_59262 [Naegleria gruberi]|uniref:Uncharacterized protein n=1 Tax=Naegleria gruberi TaxID=5762 RepID=D2VUN3_NAEGR|nr:uncharacterized protein NAEGRDRAFT_59262 [Naegleria gruberi]EFC39482.1 hypothetical protein NAEGRDRAFT_59262 [Naegleria gruberi]|eukprot:XP_002672226.1 hypothetical protein NAEGRDRAFT_59262 [Naegleria gruberi strain NEG-M]